MTASPESPQNLLLIIGLANSGDMTIALSVLMATTASPPASCTALPISAMIWVLGVILAQTGMDIDDLTAETMDFTSLGSVPTSIP